MTWSEQEIVYAEYLFNTFKVVFSLRLENVSQYD